MCYGFWVREKNSTYDILEVTRKTHFMGTGCRDVKTKEASGTFKPELTTAEGAITQMQTQKMQNTELDGNWFSGPLQGPPNPNKCQ